MPSLSSSPLSNFLVQDYVAGRKTVASPVHNAAISFLQASEHGISLHNLDTALNENLFMPFNSDDRSLEVMSTQTPLVRTCTACPARKY
jgi:hypothetical protein